MESLRCPPLAHFLDQFFATERVKLDQLVETLQRTAGVDADAERVPFIEYDQRSINARGVPGGEVEHETPAWLSVGANDERLILQLKIDTDIAAIEVGIELAPRKQRLEVLHRLIQQLGKNRDDFVTERGTVEAEGEEGIAHGKGFMWPV